MKKITTIGLLILFIVLNNACKRCHFTNYKVPSEMDSYFGMYKVGNWWLYKNQDGTKIDSLFITNFVVNDGCDKTSCICSENYTFNLVSNYIPHSTTIDCVYGEKVEPRGVNFPFSINDYHNFNYVFNYNTTSNKFSSNILVYDTIHFGRRFFINALLGTEPTQQLQLIVAKNIGIVAWITQTNDTFFISKYKIL